MKFFLFLLFLAAQLFAGVNNCPRQVSGQAGKYFLSKVRLQEQILLLERFLTLDNIRQRFDVVFQAKEKEARKAIYFNLDKEKISLLMVRDKDGRLRVSISVCQEWQNPNLSVTMMDDGGDGNLDCLGYPGTIIGGTQEDWMRIYREYLSKIFDYLRRKASYPPVFD